MKTMDTEDITRIVVAVLAAMAQPAETATQAVVSVANKAQKITWATRQKVKAQRVNRGGPIPNGPTCEELFAANIITIDGDYIAERKAPTASKTVKTAAPTKTDLKAMDRLRRKGLIA